MKLIYAVYFLSLVFNTIVKSQSAEILYSKATDLIASGELIEALPLLEQAAVLDTTSSLIFSELGFCYLSVMEYVKAIHMLNRAIFIDSSNSRTYLYRGYCREKLLDYDKAFQDYKQSSALDTLDGESLFRLGLLYEKYGNKEEACESFQKAYTNNYERAKHKTERCLDSLYFITDFNEILELRQYSTDKKYGYTSKRPVMVGKGANGGPANQRAYLDLLRDQNGKPIWYERKGSCCPYKSENGLFGSAMVDEYIIYYTNEAREQVSTSIFISFYDYEEPKVLMGFGTITRE